MKVGRGNARTEKNQMSKSLGLVLICVAALASVAWVYTMAQRASETVKVIMWADNIYKNEVITESDLVPYDMIKAEFDKYATTSSNGEKRRRIFLWEDRDKIMNTYAAYPLKKDTIAQTSDVVKSRTDNSDNVLYSFPGKNLVKLEAGESDLQSFKTFLQPGDRINVDAIYQEEQEVITVNDMGEAEDEKVVVFRTEPLFKDIMIADLLNSSGESILDMYADYNDKTVVQQAQLDASDDWQKQTQPTSLLIALTPEELTRYYYYLGKDNVEFRLSLPQRAD